MRQAIMTAPGKIEFRDVADPQPGPGQVLLRVKRIGVCGTDLHVWHGKHPFVTYPVVQGHEFSGVVEAVGEGVTGIEPGMKATATPQETCGQCRPCRRGDYHICEKLKVRGFQAPGCAQDLFVTEAEKIVLLGDEMTFEQGALVEPAAVGVHSTARPRRPIEGRNAVVLGAGTIGNMVAQMVRARGAAAVLVTDLTDFRLEIARRCGLEHTSNASQEPLADAVRRTFGEENFDLAFECAGAEAAMNAAIGAIEKGGEIVVLGVFGEQPRIDMASVSEHELSVTGSLMYKHDDWVEAVERIREGKIVTDPLDTGHWPIDKYNEVYRYLDERGPENMKTFIDVA